MGFEKLKATAHREIQKILPPNQPISSLESGHWDQELDLGDTAESELADLAVVQLKGNLTAALHLTRRNAPPEDLTAFDPDPDDARHAIASLTVKAEAGAELKYQPAIGSGADIAVGPETATGFTFAQHRRYSTGEIGREALEDLLRNLRNPYDHEALAILAEHELFHVELTGTGTLAATAGWEWGLVRSFAGSDLESLVPGDLAGVRAGVKAGVTVKVGLKGHLRILVDRSPRDPEHLVRVRLYRRRGHFAGAGIDISGEARLTQAEGYVDSIVSRILQVPEDFVDRLEELQTELRGARSLASGLSEASRQTAVAAGLDTDAPSLDQWASLRYRLDDLNVAPEGPLSKLLTALDTVTERIADLADDLASFVDDTFQTDATPLVTLEGKVDTWLDAYRKARRKAVELIVERAREGIEVELAAGINRQRAQEALLELDFELRSTPALLIEAMKGNFTPAIERARTPGATGVEIVTGTLKQIIQRDRVYSLRFNLLGFITKVDFQRFNQIQFATDLKTGSLTISGKSGASLETKQHRRLNELSFLFDVYGALERRGDEIFTAPDTRFKATLARSGEIRRQAEIQATVPRHLAGLRRLNVIGQERSDQLRDLLLTESTEAYGYDLELTFPPSAISRMFSLDLDEPRRQLRARLWNWMRQAVEILDVPVPHPRGVVPFSTFLGKASINAVERRPIASAWTAIDEVRGPDGLRFQEGAYRMAWAYLLNARSFIAAYIDSRASLLGGQRLRQVLATLENISAKTAKGSGSFATRPFDAKYLVFALAEGLKEVEIGVALRRGEIEIRL